jgi:hypothetical protein
MLEFHPSTTPTRNNLMINPKSNLSSRNDFKMATSPPSPPSSCGSLTDNSENSSDDDDDGNGKETGGKTPTPQSNHLFGIPPMFDLNQFQVNDFNFSRSDLLDVHVHHPPKMDLKMLMGPDHDENHFRNLVYSATGLREFIDPGSFLCVSRFISIFVHFRHICPCERFVISFDLCLNLTQSRLIFATSLTGRGLRVSSFIESLRRLISVSFFVSRLPSHNLRVQSKGT